MEITDVFEDEDKEEGAGITDLIRQVERLLVDASKLEELIAGCGASRARNDLRD